MGLLLYRKEGLTATAADADALKLDGKVLSPLESRSHWYFALTSEAKRLGALRDRETEIRVARKKDAENQAVVAFRPRIPIFTVKSPKHLSTYSPLDSIPLEVRFDPEYADVLKDQKFNITATLTPVETDRRGKPHLQKTIVWEKVTPKELAARTLVLDDDPDTRGRPERMGRYDVEFEITFAGTTETVNLEGATQKLARHTITVVDYPRLTNLPKEITLSNLNPQAGAAAIQLALPLETAPAANRIVANASARVQLKPLEKAPVTLAPEIVALKGNGQDLNARGTVGVSLKATDWASIRPTDRKEIGTLEFAEPWNRATPHKIPVFLHRKAYDLRSRRPDDLQFQGQRQRRRRRG